MLNGVNHRFADGEFDPMGQIITEFVFLDCLSNEGMNRRHFFEPAWNRQLEVPWLFISHRPQVTRGFFKVNDHANLSDMIDAGGLEIAPAARIAGSISAPGD